MPPRIPKRNPFHHAQKKNPLDMTLGEKVMFGVLLTSISTGMYQIVTGPWTEENSKDPNIMNDVGIKRIEESGTIEKSWKSM